MIFCPKGWVSIRDLHETLTSAMTFWLDGPVVDKIGYGRIVEHALFSAWECLESMPAAAILGPSGEAIPIETRIIASGGWINQTSNFHIGLEYGTLGSGHGGVSDENGYIETPMPSSTAQLHYGPFAYCPVLVPKASFDAFDRKFSASWQSESGYGHAEKAKESIVEQIFETIDSGRAIRRDDIKRILAKDMKVDVWRAHWREAVLSRPELGKSGPKNRSP